MIIIEELKKRFGIVNKRPWVGIEKCLIHMSSLFHDTFMEGRMDWITLDSVIFAPVTLYLENWINIVML